MNQVKIARAHSKFSLLRRICNDFPAFLVPQMAPATGAGDETRRCSLWSQSQTPKDLPAIYRYPPLSVPRHTPQKMPHACPLKNKVNKIVDKGYFNNYHCCQQSEYCQPKYNLNQNQHLEFRTPCWFGIPHPDYDSQR